MIPRIILQEENRKHWKNHGKAIRVFPMIDVESFRVLYCEDNGVSNTPVNIIVGTSIIKEFLDLSDDEVVEGLMLDNRLQYALHSTNFEEQPLSDKNLSHFCKHGYDYYEKTGIDFMHNCIVSLSSEIARFAKSSSEKCLMLLKDADSLFNLCKDTYTDREEYILFNRCMDEQTIADGGTRRLATHEDGTMYSSMLQNSSNTYATFCSKAGEEHRGYVANLEH